MCGASSTTDMPHARVAQQIAKRALQGLGAGPLTSRAGARLARHALEEHVSHRDIADAVRAANETFGTSFPTGLPETSDSLSDLPL